MSPDDPMYELGREVASLGTKLDTFVIEQRNLNQSLRRALYGESGINGIQGTMKDLKIAIQGLDTRIGAIETMLVAKKKTQTWLWKEMLVKTLIVGVLVYAGQKVVDYLVTHAH